MKKYVFVILLLQILYNCASYSKNEIVYDHLIESIVFSWGVHQKSSIYYVTFIGYLKEGPQHLDSFEIDFIKKIYKRDAPSIGDYIYEKAEGSRFYVRDTNDNFVINRNVSVKWDNYKLIISKTNYTDIYTIKDNKLFYMTRYEGYSNDNNLELLNEYDFNIIYDLNRKHATLEYKNLFYDFSRYITNHLIKFDSNEYNSICNSCIEEAKSEKAKRKYDIEGVKSMVMNIMTTNVRQKAIVYNKKTGISNEYRLEYGTRDENILEDICYKTLRNYYTRKK